jgi:hypothetical protein
MRIDGYQQFWTLERDDYGCLTPPDSMNCTTEKRKDPKKPPGVLETVIRRRQRRNSLGRRAYQSSGLL